MSKLFPKILLTLALGFMLGTEAYAAGYVVLGGNASHVSPQRSGDDTTGPWSSGAGAVDISSAGTNEVEANSSGWYVVNNLMVGHNGVLATAGSGAPQIENNGNINSTTANLRWTVGTSGSVFILGQSAGNAIGTHGAIASGNNEGEVQWQGDDGTNFDISSEIIGAADGAVSTGIVPGRIVFSTANTSGAMTEAGRINDAQQFTIGTTTPDTGALLTVSTGVSAKQFIGHGSAPTIAVGAAAGSGASATLTGNDVGGTINLTTGTGTTGSATLATVTFNGTLGVAPQACHIFAENAAASSQTAMLYIAAPSTTTWVISVGTLPITTSTSYQWTYLCGG